MNKILVILKQSSLEFWQTIIRIFKNSIQIILRAHIRRIEIFTIYFSFGMFQLTRKYFVSLLLQIQSEIIEFIIGHIDAKRQKTSSKDSLTFDFFIFLLRSSCLPILQLLIQIIYSQNGKIVYFAENMTEKDIQCLKNPKTNKFKAVPSP